jgi:hypothetical protein
MPLYAQPMATFPVRNAATIKLSHCLGDGRLLDLSESAVRVLYAERLCAGRVRSELNRFPCPTGSTVGTITAPASAIIGD